MNIKKWIALLLTLLLAVSLTACNSLPNSVADVGNSSSPSSGLTDDGSGVGYPDEDGYAEGYLGDTMHTYWFDFSINSAYTCAEFDGLTAEDGYKFLVAEVTMKNTTKSSQPMSLFDFQLDWWNYAEGENEDDAYAWPMYNVVETEDGDTDYVSVSELQLPTVYDLKINEERTGILLYMVPEHAENFSISFGEYFEDDTTGDLFYVWFNAEEQ